MDFYEGEKKKKRRRETPLSPIGIFTSRPLSGQGPVDAWTHQSSAARKVLRRMAAVRHSTDTLNTSGQHSEWHGLHSAKTGICRGG